MQCSCVLYIRIAPSAIYKVYTYIYLMANAIGWWFVAVERKEGWAPCSYLEPKRDAKSDDSGKSSEATSEEEEDNLKMNEEAIISKYG